MAKGKRRAKARSARAASRAAKMAGYSRREDGQPDERTAYGARWHARRRGEPMAARSNQPWWITDRALACRTELEALAEKEADAAVLRHRRRLSREGAIP